MIGDGFLRRSLEIVCWVLWCVNFLLYDENLTGCVGGWGVKQTGGLLFRVGKLIVQGRLFSH